MNIEDLIAYHKNQAKIARAELNSATWGTGLGPQEKRDKYYFHLDAIEFLKTLEGTRVSR
jgi:hypothetical protein